MNKKEIIEECFNILESITECNWPDNTRVNRDKLISGLAQTDIDLTEYFGYKESTGIYRVFSRSINDYKDLKGSINTYRNFILSFDNKFCCSNCKEFLDINSSVKDCYTCKPCKKKLDKQNKNKKREFVYQYLIDNPCTDCGETDPIVLEFDHTNPSNKSYNVSELFGHIMEDIIKEISKCEVVCANCHKRRTAKQQNWYKWEKENKLDT